MTSVSNYFAKEYYGLTIPNASPKRGVSEPSKNNYNESEGEQRAVLVVWLNSIIPDLSLPVKASEEELRTCLIDGVILCQILRRLRPGILNEDGASDSESRSETVTRFLLAMDEMRLPRFEIFDLEQGSMRSVVECLLKIKALFMSKAGADNVPISSLFTKSANNTSDLKFQRPQCSPVLPDPGAMIHHVGHKFHEVFQLKQGCYADIPAAKISEMMKSNSLDNAPTQSLLSVLNGILDESVERKNGEIPHRVACLLRKVVQEIERRISTQAEHLRAQNNLFKTREEKYQSRIRVLETLASGTSEETQIVMNKLQQAKTEKIRMEEKKKFEEEDVVKLMQEKDQYSLEISSLKQELETTRNAYENRCLQMEEKAGGTELELHGRLTDLETLLKKSRDNMNELEAHSETKSENWKRKEHVYKIYIDFQIGKLNELRCSSDSLKQNILDTQRSYSHEFNLLGANVKALADSAANYDDVFAENRRLFNEVQELKGNIRVYCRIRPFLSGQAVGQSIIEHIGENGELVVTNPSKQGNDGHRLFKFNNVFGPASTQAEVFYDTQPLVRSVLDGYNVCIFAYGQTGSGKTYTMTGPVGASKENGDWGVNYRALNDLFHFAQSRRSTFIYEICVQMVEVYNEQVRDLLSNDSTQKKLGIVNSSQVNGLAVPDASMHTVKSTSHVLNLMDVGQKNRAVGATALNTRSSRSHSVVTILVHGTDVKSGATFRGNLHLVDLAGSERVDRSEAVGERLKEAQHINKSLSALGDVIFALSQSNSHVPYRNSKLTQLLHTSLGGQAKTLMFVQLNPDVDSFSESLSTLKFAERVAGVELGAARSSKDGRYVRDLMEQVSCLKGVISKKDEEIERLQVLKDVKSVVYSPGVNDPLRRRVSSPNLQKGSKAVSEASDSGSGSGFVDEGSDISDTDVFVESTTSFSDSPVKVKASVPLLPKAVRPPKKASLGDSAPTDEILKMPKSLRKPAPAPVLTSQKSSKRWQ